jgi:hypothetical protein
MKRSLLLIFLCISIVNLGIGQITSPQIKANFGVEADLRANFYDGFVVNGNDDWFSNLAGIGKGVIELHGASLSLEVWLIRNIP